MKHYEGLKINLLNKAVGKSNVVCQQCGNLTDNKLIPIAELYPHSEGFSIKGYNGKQQVSYKCECGHQNLLMVLLKADGSDIIGKYFAEVFRNARRINPQEEGKG